MKSLILIFLLVVFTWSCLAQAQTNQSDSIAAANFYGGNLFGNGSGLTALNGSQVTTGTVPDARLSGNVALLNGNPQTFTGSNIFSGGLSNSAQTSLNTLTVGSTANFTTISNLGGAAGIGPATGNDGFNVNRNETNTGTLNVIGGGLISGNGGGLTNLWGNGVPVITTNAVGNLGSGGTAALFTTNNSVNIDSQFYVKFTTGTSANASATGTQFWHCAFSKTFQVPPAVGFVPYSRNAVISAFYYGFIFNVNTTGFDFYGFSPFPSSTGDIVIKVIVIPLQN